MHKWISGGSKQLIMMYNEQKIIYCGNNLGDNCWSLLLELSKTHDLAIDLSYYPKFEWVDNIPIHIINNNKIIDNFKDFISEHIDDPDNIYEFSDIQWPIEVDLTKFE